MSGPCRESEDLTRSFQESQVIGESGVCVCVCVCVCVDIGTCREIAGLPRWR